ncbi:MAG: dihydroorotate dehydrogenase [Acidobacteria bacterium]|nr:dihydroorotate dehydrogenase [Acidobacteriota bacterium]
MEMKTDLGRGLVLKNPVMLASGTAGFGMEFTDFYSLDKLGAIVTKGVSMEPIAGNPAPRIVEASGGMINSIGLQNPGARVFADELLPRIREYDVACVVNVFGHSDEAYAEVVEFLEGVEGIDGYEVNISCPNVKHGGIQYGTNPEMTRRLVKELRCRTNRHLMVKLSPNVTDITEFAAACEDAGADSISLVNTLLGMAVDVKTRRPEIARIVGGYSGPSIKPVALRMVYQAVKRVSIPVIGIGGIQSAEDALEFLLVGARAVQVGTANFYDPGIGGRLADEIGRWLNLHGAGSLDSWIGSLKV